MQDSGGTSTVSLYDNAGGSNCRRIYLIEVLSLDIDENSETQLSNPLLLLMDTSSSDMEKTQSAGKE